MQLHAALAEARLSLQQAKGHHSRKSAAHLFHLDEGFGADQGSHDGQHELQRGRRSHQNDEFHILPEGVAHLPVARCQPAWRYFVPHTRARIEEDKDIRTLHSTDNILIGVRQLGYDIGQLKWRIKMPYAYSYMLNLTVIDTHEV